MARNVESPRGNLIAGLDIGTSKIVAVIADMNDGGHDELLGVGIPSFLRRSKGAAYLSDGDSSTEITEANSNENEDKYNPPPFLRLPERGTMDWLATRIGVIDRRFAWLSARGLRPHQKLLEERENIAQELSRLGIQLPDSSSSQEQYDA